MIHKPHLKGLLRNYPGICDLFNELQTSAAKALYSGDYRLAGELDMCASKLSDSWFHFCNACEIADAALNIPIEEEHE